MNWNQFEAIHPSVKQKLMANGFNNPTQVQIEVLNNYIYKKHIIIASQTGSGKTLAFGIPLVSEIMKNLKTYPQNQIIALILTPTRELAMQIYKHLKVITDLQIGCLVGGMSKEKQRRVINQAPHIFIATPGRLWDFIENEENEVLKKLNLIQFLIIDEADRMVELGHFPQLDNIMTKITSPSQITHDKQAILQLMKNRSDAAYLNNQKITFEVEKPVEMSYEDFLKLQNTKAQIIEEGNDDNQEIEEIDQGEDSKEEFEEDKEQNQEEVGVEEEEGEGEEEEGEEEEEEGEEEEDEEENMEYNEELEDEVEQKIEDEEIIDEEEVNNEEQDLQLLKKGQKEQKQKVVDKQKNKRPTLRTFLVSATLTHQFKSGSKFQFLKNQQNGQNQQSQTDKADKQLIKQMKETVPKLQSLLGKLKIKEEPFIIDLTQQLVFPEKLQFYKSLMEEDDKLLHIYHWIQDNPEQTFIIFLNSITYANKVTSMLKVLGLTCVTLHSQQQQRQRLSKLDQFKEKKCNILVCTDVAARGLDIVGVENVIHYQVPFTADTFVHRCGRTARINREGKTLILIGPKDMVRFTKLEQDIVKNGIVFQEYKLTYNQVKKTREMIKQAQKLEKEDHSLKKKKNIKEALQKQLQNDDCDLDEKEVKQELENENHSLKKKKNIKEALQKQLQNDDCDLDEKEVKQELENIEEELLTKRKKLNQERLQYQTIVSQKNKLDPRFEKRRNGLFLSPEETVQLAEKLKQQREQQQQKQQSQQNNNNPIKKKDKFQGKQSKGFKNQ